MVLWHITPERNISSILAIGLIPGHNQVYARYGLATSIVERRKLVWLTNDPLHIILHQAGWNWVTRRKAKALVINPEGLDISMFVDELNNLCKEQFVTKYVPRENIIKVIGCLEAIDDSKRKS